MSNINSNSNAEITEDLLRHMILSSILYYRKKFKDQYGEIVIVCDGRNYWRKKVFPYYKANRKRNRDKSKYDWSNIFDILNKLKDEIKNTFPYRVIQVETAEADDIIASLVKRSQVKDLRTEGLFDVSEPILICSSDKDFLQLQKYENVKQYSPMKKRFLTHNNPKLYLKEHIMRGDSGDGIPNFLSPDDVFITENVKQKPIRKKKLQEWLKQDIESFCDSGMLRNYKRNEMLISFDCIPKEIYENVDREYEKGPVVGAKSKLFDYFVKKRLRYLMEHLSEF